MTANRTALRRRLALSTALCVAAFAAAPAAAQVMTGFGTINSTVGNPNPQVNGNVLDVVASGNAIINWNDFNVSNGYRANYSHANGVNAPNISILNRVQGSNITNIFGEVTSGKNVSVYIINPNGIVFGSSARVNVGALVASTLNLTNDNDFLNGNSALRFTSPVGSTRGIVVAPGAVLNTGGGGDIGDLVLLANQISSAGDLTAQGDVGIVAGEDITVTRTANSPLAFRIDRGTSVANAMTLGSNITGKSVIAGFFSKAGVNNALLNINEDSVIKATGAVADWSGGVHLQGGKGSSARIDGPSDTDSRNSVSIAVGSGSEITGNFYSQSTGNQYLLGKINAGVATIYGSDLEISDLSSTYAVTIYGDTINIGSLYDNSAFGTSIRYDESLSFGAIASRDDVIISTLSPQTAQNISGGSLTARFGIQIDVPGSVSISTIDGGSNKVLIKSGSNIDIDSLKSWLFDMTAVGDMTIRGLNVGYGSLVANNINLSGPDVAATYNLELSANNLVQIDTDLSASSISIDAKNVTSKKLSATGTLDVFARDGNATLGDLSGNSISVTTGGSGNITVGNVAAVRDFTAAGSGTFTGGLITAGGDAEVAASNVALAGDMTAASIFLDGQNVTAQKLTSTGSTVVVRAYNGDANVQGIDAKGSAAINTGGSGNVVVTGDVKTGGDFGIGASGSARVDGNVDVGNNYDITALAISLGGDADAEVQRAGNAITLKSTVGSIVGGEGLTLQANRNRGLGGRLTMDSAADIFFADGTTQIVGGDDGDGYGGLAIEGGTPQQSIKLGNVRAYQLFFRQSSLASVVIGNADLGMDLNINARSIETGNIKVSAGSVNLAGANNGLEIHGNVSASGSVSLDGYVSVQGNIAAGSNVTATGSNFYAGDVRSSNGSISITANDSLTMGNLFAATDITLAGPSASGSGNIRMGGAEAGRNLNVSLAGGGNVEISGNIKAGGNVDISSHGGVEMADGTSITANQTNGNIKIFGRYGADLGALDAHDISLSTSTGGLLALGGNIKAATLDLEGAKVVQQTDTSVTLDKLTGRNLGSVNLEGSNKIKEIGDFAASGNSYIKNIGDGLLVSGDISALGQHILLSTDGNLTLAAGSSVFGRYVHLGAFQNFINNAGADAVVVDGYWRIYSNTPEGNVYGGLDSGNTAIWGWENSDAVGSGSHYVFKYRPTLTFTSIDYAKTYGDDIAALLAGRYTVSGLHEGVAGAFLGDTLADVISGSPLLTSLGATARASVAGGPYVIEIGQGSLVSNAGYKFAFNNAGRVTVAKKALTATVAIKDKTYDGTTQATGSFSSLNGLVQGDVVEVGGKLTFASKNAGTQKVTVENLGLAGADAGNYTVTISVPDQLSATIFKKAVSVQVAVDDKTYDGTKNATGHASIDGKIAGDDLTATGGIYSFGDKNAGTGKLVTISNIVIGGADAGNYEVTIPASVLADILKKAVTVNVSVDNKTYDQTTTATGRINGIDGLIAGDDVEATGGSYAFADKNAGKGKTVNVSGIQLSGDDLANYEVTIPATILAEIMKKAVTVSIIVDDKTYDGTTSATGRIADMEGVIAGDDLEVTGGTFAFTDKNAGQDKAATASGFTFAGDDAGNYETVVAPGATADIAKRTIAIRANDATGTIFSPAGLTYTITNGSLAPGDAFTGALAREPGYTPGEYAIGIGTLSLSPNYDMTFEGGTYTLEIGSIPSWAQVPDLYRNFELGGRAAVLRNEPRALTWAAAFDCQGTTQLSGQCQ
ncbi:beta strand repeat-containing protein [Allosphingosinicella vermicomposti]|uniref:beta strand repeat-containing protein n=1 Tax=Allosphingosinicella vermicomposti TaxID=614671 RepID=UPI00131A597A|nr:YDG domain-containing protein [Allosphingosinicella vermicomposti]